MLFQARLATVGCRDMPRSEMNLGGGTDPLLTEADVGGREAKKEVLGGFCMWLEHLGQ